MRNQILKKALTGALKEILMFIWMTGIALASIMGVFVILNIVKDPSVVAYSYIYFAAMTWTSWAIIIDIKTRFLKPKSYKIVGYTGNNATKSNN